MKDSNVITVTSGVIDTLLCNIQRQCMNWIGRYSRKRNGRKPRKGNKTNRTNRRGIKVEHIEQEIQLLSDFESPPLTHRLSSNVSDGLKEGISAIYTSSI